MTTVDKEPYDKVHRLIQTLSNLEDVDIEIKKRGKVVTIKLRKPMHIIFKETMYWLFNRGDK